MHSMFWGKRILSCNDTKFLLHIFSFFCFCNATFFHSGYVIKPSQPSFALYRAPLFTGRLSKSIAKILTRTFIWKKNQNIH